MKWLYAGTLRLLYTVSYPFLRVYFQAKPSHRVRVAIRCGDEVLLVKTAFSAQHLSFPGGGINTSELPANAAVREAYEETGLKLPADNLRFVGKYTLRQTLPFQISLFECRVDSRELPSLKFPYSMEIIERKWVSVRKLDTTRDSFKVYLERDATA